MSSHWLLELWPGVVLISWSGVTASLKPLQVAIRGTLSIVEYPKALLGLSEPPVRPY